MNLSAPLLGEASLSICCISLHGYDKLRLLNVPAELHNPFAELIQQSWHRGIQNRSIYAGALQFKLKGYPWLGQGGDAVPCRLLGRDIMAFMYHDGWAIAVAVGLSKKSTDKDSWFFKRVTPDPNARFAAISLNMFDRVRIIGAPENLVQACVQCVRASWPKGIQQEGLHDGAFELKLKGNPWRSYGTEEVVARSLVIHLISTIEREGWAVYASVDISGRPQKNDSHNGDLDSWILKSTS